MRGPEEEEQSLDKLIDLQIDQSIEDRHLKCMVCEAGELDEDGYCGSCNAKTDF